MITWTLIDANSTDDENDIYTLDSLEQKIDSFINNADNYPVGDTGEYKKPEFRFIICEGDSWFSYCDMPRYILENLEKHPANDTNDKNIVWVVINIAGTGDALVRDILSNKQRFYMKRLLSKYKEHIKCVLLSAGGNDVIDNMPIMFKDGQLDTNALTAQIDMLEIGYRKIIDIIHDKLDDKNTPIFSHSYSYLCAFSKECDILKRWFTNCPWIHPHMKENNISQTEMENAIKQMFNMFSDRIGALLDITMADTKQALQDANGNNNPNYWEDEIHPNKNQDGIGKIADIYAQTILKNNPELFS